VQEFSGKHNIRDLNTLSQMQDMVSWLIGRNLLRQRRTENNRLYSMTRA